MIKALAQNKKSMPKENQLQVLREIKERKKKVNKLKAHLGNVYTKGL